MGTMTATARGGYTDEDARALGHYRGTNAANYAANVSGEDLDTLTPDDVRPLRMTDRARMFFNDGFSTAVDAFKLADELADEPEYADA